MDSSQFDDADEDEEEIPAVAGTSTITNLPGYSGAPDASTMNSMLPSMLGFERCMKSNSIAKSVESLNAPETTAAANTDLENLEKRTPSIPNGSTNGSTSSGIARGATTIIGGSQVEKSRFMHTQDAAPGIGIGVGVGVGVGLGVGVGARGVVPVAIPPSTGVVGRLDAAATTASYLGRPQEATLIHTTNGKGVVGVGSQNRPILLKDKDDEQTARQKAQKQPYHRPTQQLSSSVSPALTNLARDATTTSAQSTISSSDVAPVQLREVERSVVVPTETIQHRVFSAAALVAQELRSGIWPSPEMDEKTQKLQEEKNGKSGAEQCTDDEELIILDGADSKKQKSKENQHPNRKTKKPKKHLPSGSTPSAAAVHKAAHGHIVAAAVEQFAGQVILPSMLASSENPPNSSREYKTFLGTLLILREVLTQNAENVFGTIAIPPPSDPRLLPAKQQGKGKQKYTKIQLREQEKKKLFLAQILATGVILAAIENLEDLDLSKKATEAFLQVSSSYDGDTDNALFSPDSITSGPSARSNEFLSCMEAANCKWYGISLNSDTPRASKLGSEQLVAWRISYNQARKKHPIIKRNEQKEIQQKEHINSSNIYGNGVYTTDSANKKRKLNGIVTSHPRTVTTSSPHDATQGQNSNNGEDSNLPLHLRSISVPNPNLCHMSLIEDVSDQLKQTNDLEIYSQY